MNTIEFGDCRDIMRRWAAEGVQVQTCVTSPPYWGLRDYGTDGQLGLEETPEEYVANMVEVFRCVRDVLRDDGTLWLNLGDTYNAYNGGAGPGSTLSDTQSEQRPSLATGYGLQCKTLKPKDLIGIPWRVAFALQADGWYLRQDIIWCLSGGTWLYVRSQKGDMPMMLKDVARLDPATVQLWNGEKWTQLRGVSKSERLGDELELVLRSGERIACTPTHKFPTERGLLQAGKIRVGDVLKQCQLPQPGGPAIFRTWNPHHIGDDAAWLAGLYLAEGSKSGSALQLAGHAKETERWERCKRIAESYGGSASVTVNGNNQAIRLYGKVIHAIVDMLVAGKTAKDKGFAVACWQHDDGFIRSMLEGYLHGDGHWDGRNKRWRIGFTRNYRLERDLRTACARLGYQITLNPSQVRYQGGLRPAFRGEIRTDTITHHNSKSRMEVVDIRKSRCRYVYDLGVEDEPHLFALASGVLTHNSKPNPMPESVRDRCTKAHEYLFLLTKSPRYYYDAEAIAEARVDPESLRDEGRGHRNQSAYETSDPERGRTRLGFQRLAGVRYPTRNRRTVWTVTTKPFKGAHFATFPPDLIEPCIKAGTSEEGCCVECGAPFQRIVDKTRTFESGSGRSGNRPTGKHGEKLQGGGETLDIRLGPCVSSKTLDWLPTCDCDPHNAAPCVVLDPFMGSGTTAMVARQFGRNYLGCELNREYEGMQSKRITAADRPLFT